MVSHRTLTVSVTLLFAADLLGGFPTDRFLLNFSINNKEGRRIEGGVLYVEGNELQVKRHSTLGRIGDKEDAADRWYIDGVRLKSSVGGGYLSYDPTGKNPRVFLAAKPGAGSEWLVMPPGKGHNEEGKTASLQAAHGPYKGWFLAVEEVEGKPGGGKEYRPLLQKEPQTRLKVGRIFHHK